MVFWLLYTCLGARKSGQILKRIPRRAAVRTESCGMADERHLICGPDRKAKCTEHIMFASKGSSRHGSHTGRTRHLFLGSRIFDIAPGARRSLALLELAHPRVSLSSFVWREGFNGLSRSVTLSGRAPKLYSRPGFLPNVADATTLAHKNCCPNKKITAAPAY